jgi:predicted amidohydrolase YtcJ
MAEVGLTGVHDAGLTLDQIRTLQRAADEGWLTARVYAMIGGDIPALDHFCEDGLLLGYGDGRVTVRSLKLYVDGALGSRGAALIEEYSDDPGNHGLLMMEPAAYGTVVDRAMGCGLQVNSHAIGDRGARVVLDAYEAALSNHPENPGRHRMEHAQVLADAEIARFAPLGVIASVQPTHATSDMPWAEQRVGDRIEGAYAWRRLAQSGARLALGSDFPVERVNPMLGFYAAVTRQDAEGMPEGGWYADQVLTREEALKGFTLDAAYAGFQEDELGTIAAGKRADFVVLGRDPMTAPADELLGTEVLMTVVGGEVVYDSDAVNR